MPASGWQPLVANTSHCVRGEPNPRSNDVFERFCASLEYVSETQWLIWVKSKEILKNGHKPFFSFGMLWYRSELL